jgi:hypothetical protein
VSNGVKSEKVQKMGIKQRLPIISTFVIDMQCVYCEGGDKLQVASDYFIIHNQLTRYIATDTTTAKF